MSISKINGLALSSPDSRGGIISPLAAANSGRLFRRRYNAASAQNHSGKSLTQFLPGTNRSWTNKQPAAVESRIASRGMLKPAISTPLPGPIRGTLSKAAVCTVQNLARFQLRKYDQSKKKARQSVRTAVKSIADELGISITNILYDPENESMTLVFESDRWNGSTFSLHKKDAQWNLSVVTKSAADSEALMESEAALQRRFRDARLGNIQLQAA